MWCYQFLVYPLNKREIDWLIVYVSFSLVMMAYYICHSAPLLFSHTAFSVSVHIGLPFKTKNKKLLVVSIVWPIYNSFNPFSIKMPKYSLCSFQFSPFVCNKYPLCISPLLFAYFLCFWNEVLKSRVSIHAKYDGSLFWQMCFSVSLESAQD